MADTDRNRYDKAPIMRFVDSYVSDVIGALPPERSVAIQQFDWQRTFKTPASEKRTRRFRFRPGLPPNRPCATHCPA